MHILYNLLLVLSVVVTAFLRALSAKSLTWETPPNTSIDFLGWSFALSFPLLLQGLVVDDGSPVTPIYDTHELDPGTQYTYYIYAVYNNMASVPTSDSSMCTKPAEPLQVPIFP